MSLKKTMLCLGAASAALIIGTVQAATTSFTVNGELVSKAQQEQLIKATTARGQARTPQLENQVRYLLTRDKLLLQEAKKQKIASRDDVRRMIDNATKNILMSTVINDWVAKNPIKDEDVKALFDSEKKRWGNTEVSVRHILVKDEKAARQILKDVRNGGDFDKIAREKSIDTLQNRALGGLIEWNSPNMFDKEFAASFKNLKPGQIAKNPVKTHLGWHVVKLEGKRPAQRYSNYEAEAPLLRQLLTQQRVQTYVDNLIKAAKIEDVADAKKGKK